MIVPITNMYSSGSHSRILIHLKKELLAEKVFIFLSDDEQLHSCASKSSLGPRNQNGWYDDGPPKDGQ